jgi:c(7)-type cytochrome triheme protein
MIPARPLMAGAGLVLLALLLVLFPGPRRVGAEEGTRPALPPTQPESKLPRSRAIYPPERIPLHFSHQTHLSQGIDCGYCHEDAARSTRATDRLLPGHDQCEMCHALDDPDDELPGGCPACHVGYEAGLAPPPVVIPPANLNFDHAAHVGLGLSCEDCHADIRTTDLATRAQMPKMALCLDCHDGATAAGECATCHLTGDSGHLVQEFPTGILEPGPSPLGMDHRAPNWLYDHELAGRTQAALCESCHTPQSCIDCHDGTRKPFAIHPADWVTTHPVAARQDAFSCVSCHRAQSYCIDCHERVGIGPDAPVGRVLGPETGDPTFRAPTINLAFHPPEWLDESRPDHPSFHGRQAALNIQTCASCHREETCLACHATATRGIDPHPPGFVDRCRSQARRNQNACLKCHVGVPEICL